MNSLFSLYLLIFKQHVNLNIDLRFKKQCCHSFVVS
uniref:Uncharacterized protein n=1 Tax=Rhizophora mucronata TaxID=61149 RepID=A0A2P2Q9N9_RHIMU